MRVLKVKDFVDVDGWRRRYLLVYSGGRYYVVRVYTKGGFRVVGVSPASSLEEAEEDFGILTLM